MRVPILMYHSVSERDECNRHPYYETNVRPEVFIQQMQYLADNDYQVISLNEVLPLLSRDIATGIQSPSAKHKIHQKYCVLTFDDGFRDFFHTAWPILRNRQFIATMFLPTGLISKERCRIGTRDCMTWSEIVTLANEGVEFGAHTVSHVQLYDMTSLESKKLELSSSRHRECSSTPVSYPTLQDSVIELTPIEYEVRASKQALEEILSKPVNYYSYAYAFPEHDRNFVSMYEQILRQAGYRAAVSTRIGRAKCGDDPFILKRIPINSNDDPCLFRAKLAGAYDWLAFPQRLSKKLRARREA